MNLRTVLWVGLVWVSFSACQGKAEEKATSPAPCWCRWRLHPGNPLIEPPHGQAIVGDPAFLPPGETPDGRWHLFAYTIKGIFHYTSDDGLAWAEPGAPQFPGLNLRPYLFREGGFYYILYEEFTDGFHSRIIVRKSADLNTWGDAVVLLTPSLAWESDMQSTNSNPYLIARDGGYWLYYSANSVVLPDVSFFEPRYLAVAHASAITGPYVKEANPLMGPSPTDPWRNLGAGSMKLWNEKVDNQWLAFNNGIYLDAEKKSHSTLLLLKSTDGLAWAPACANPILAPQGDGWMKQYVYAFDARKIADGSVRLYFNARDGGLGGHERIGLATLDSVPAGLPDGKTCR